MHAVTIAMESPTPSLEDMDEEESTQLVELFQLFHKSPLLPEFAFGTIWTM